MKRTFSVLRVLLLLLLIALPSSAQQANLPFDQKGLVPASPGSGLTKATPVHLTPHLVRSEEGQAALAEYRRLKTLGLVEKAGLGSVAASLTPGTERTFLLNNFESSSVYNETFTLVATHPLFNIWVANSDLASKGQGGFVEEQDWQSLATDLGDSTPAGSWNSTMGIIAINEQVFGPPSDIDNNGRVDVLVHDILDGYNPNAGSNQYTAGYYNPGDLQSPNAADIVHLDTVPSMFSTNGSRQSTEFSLQTLAHEFQHLIFAVQHGAFDLTFIDEGLAEWAEVVNGYTPRTISYLGSAGELARTMLDFRTNPYGGPESEDYQRGGLFHHYLAERLSTELVGSISRGSGQGVGNYINLFTQSQLDPDILMDLVQGYHVANLINDQTLSPNYGYESPFRAGIRATGFQTIDGSLQSSSSSTGTLGPGAVRYQKWTQVGSFELNVRASSAVQADRLKPILYLKDALGDTEVVLVDVGGEPVQMNGNFSEVSLILPHADLTTSATASYTVDASWQPYTGSAQLQQLVYDGGQADMVQGAVRGYGLGGSSSVSLPLDSEFANGFDIPDGAALVGVDISMYFFDFFGLNPSSSVRDFALKIYDDDGGVPGDLILEKEIAFFMQLTTPDLTFQNIDLRPHQDVLGDKQGRVYISLANAGSDDNHVFLSLSPSSQAGTTSGYLYTNFGGGTGWAWLDFSDIVDGSGNPAFEGFSVPIRATIDLSAGATDIDDVATLPTSVTLEQNYPNPFNPTTQIRFHLPTSSDVRLEVFDLLGRKVMTLVDRTLPAGSHDVSFDGADLVSGLYLYSLTTPESRMTRTMTLLK